VLEKSVGALLSAENRAVLACRVASEYRTSRSAPADSRFVTCLYLSLEPYHWCVAGVLYAGLVPRPPAMKIKTISRSEDAATRDSRREVVKVAKNVDPRLHPFEKAREVRGLPCLRQ
jgi:hypothetical protein